MIHCSIKALVLAVDRGISYGHIRYYIYRRSKVQYLSRDDAEDALVLYLPKRMYPLNISLWGRGRYSFKSLIVKQTVQRNTRSLLWPSHR